MVKMTNKNLLRTTYTYDVEDMTKIDIKDIVNSLFDDQRDIISIRFQGIKLHVTYRELGE